MLAAALSLPGQPEPAQPGTAEQQAQPGLAENPGAAARQVCCPWVINSQTDEAD